MPKPLKLFGPSSLHEYNVHNTHVIGLLRSEKGTLPGIWVPVKSLDPLGSNSSSTFKELFDLDQVPLPLLQFLVVKQGE